VGRAVDPDEVADPRGDLVRGGARGFVEVDDAERFAVGPRAVVRRGAEGGSHWRQKS
jgi:hypothetical protein